VALSSQDADADSDGDVPHRTFCKGREASGVVVTEPGRGPAIAELAAAARPSRKPSESDYMSSLESLRQGPRQAAST
jgi:hypothetical protein